jgi:uridine kinase
MAEHPLLIGVAGGSGSGKTTVVQRIVDAIGPGDVAVLHHDSYYRDAAHLPPAERAAINYDHPDALETELLIRDLEALLAGRPAEVPIYDFARHVRSHETRRSSPGPSSSWTGSSSCGTRGCAT